MTFFDASSEGRVVDEFLVMHCQRGDKMALSALITKWQPPFMRYVMRYVMRYAAVITRDPTLAADVVQEAWIKIIRSLPRLGRRLSFRPGRTESSTLIAWMR